MYIKEKFGNAHIVFDGYNIHNTKDEKHYRRVGKVPTRDVLVENHIQAPMSQQEFLGNTKNKARFITLLSTHLKAAGCKVHQAEADADRLIVTTAIGIGESGVEPVLIRKDTDLLVLLIALASPDIDIKMLMPANKAHPHKICTSKSLQNAMGDMKSCLLFLHVITGCYTKSALHCKGKKVPFNKL